MNRLWALPHGDDRGGALEAVVSRLKVLSEKPSLRNLPLGSVRFVACSATVPNLHDVGRWLQVRHPPAIDLIDTIAVFLSHPFPFPCLY